jgi:Peptidase U49
VCEMRNDEEVQSAAKALFFGCAPERREELSALWGKLKPEFQVHADNHPDGQFIFDAGAYRYVRFNARAMRLFWLGAYIAWEGFCATPNECDTPTDFSRFKSMLDVFLATMSAADPESVDLPVGVPEPGTFPGAAGHPNGQAPAELATVATAWSLLHEVRHLQHQQDGTGTDPDTDDQTAVRGEETSCDQFATEFLMEKVADYAAESGFDEARVLQKRQLGVYMALFTIALLTKDRWGTSDSHPALADRLEAAKACFGSQRQSEADHIAELAFQALGHAWPGAPIFAAEAAQ